MRAGVYVGRASRLRWPRVARGATRPHAGHRPLPRRRTTRPRRRRPRRPCRAGAPKASKLNVAFKKPDLENVGASRAASATHRLRSGLQVDRTTPRRLAVGPATRGLPAGCPGEPTTTWQHMSSRCSRRPQDPLRWRLPVGHDPERLLLPGRHVPLGLPARRRHQVDDKRLVHLFTERRAAASFEAPSIYDSRVDGVLAASTRRRRVVARDESTAAASRRSRPAQASSS